jgi:hypothetical protein
MSFAHPPSPAIPIEKLEPGVRYRIHHKKKKLPPRIGIFVRINESNLFDTKKQHAIFKDTIKPNNIKPHVPTATSAYLDNEWTFHQSGEEISKNKALSGVQLPNEVLQIIRKYGGGKTRRRRIKRSKTRRS